MNLQTSAIRSDLVRPFPAAPGCAGACSQRQREDAQYERGRKAGLGEAIVLVDTWLRSEEIATRR